ncbi:MAG: hypothetical protein HY816_16790 [Candidatus Wallbacteria bacterium]|nr:hypothetical protein [Candidatus Wallbacteria bacterium]
MSAPFRLLLWLASVTPLALGRRLAVAVGHLTYWLHAESRARSLESLAIAFGQELSPGELRSLARRSLAELAMTLFEFLKMPSMTDAEVVRTCPVEGLELLEPLRGRPAIYFSGHIGNVIMLGAALTRLGHRITTVVRPFTNAGMRELVQQVAKRFAIGVIERRGRNIGAQSSEVLERGDVLGLITDQDAGARGIFVEFFGRPASTFLGTAQLSRQHGVPVVPMFCGRRPDGSLFARIEPPMPLAFTGDKDRDDAENTARHVAILERWVRDVPGSYLWLHRRWKTQPPSEDAAPLPPLKPTEPPG